MKIVTFADVVGEIARRGLRQGDVAAMMGITSPAFSNILADRAGRPSDKWKARFQDALNSIDGIPADR